MVVGQEETNFWKALEGQLFEGRFALEKYLGVSDGVATFTSTLEGSEQPVLVKIVPLNSQEGERLSASWTLAEQLEHPHLIRVFASGVSRLDDLGVGYAVTEAPDAELSTVLEGRHLTPEEGRSLLEDCTEALQFLHGQGLVHADVRPEAILSVDEQIKLSTNRIIRANEQFTPADDLRALQATISQALGEIPPPKTTPRVSRAWLDYAVPIACIAILGAIWFTRKTEQPPPAVAKAIVPAHSEPADAERTREQPSAPKPSAFKGPGNWLVVVYTYARASDAEHKAADINKIHPDLQARVLASRTGSAHLVVLGNGTDKEDALKLRDQARAAGLPSDSYVQNF